MLKIQKYLRETPLEEAIKYLTEELFLRIREDEYYMMFNYDQIDSPKRNEFVMECRGLILEKGTWNLVAFPFERFFNFGELQEEHSKINFSEYMIQEKVDGSLISVWFDYHRDKWQVSTRGTLYAESAVGITPLTFRELFFIAFNESKLKQLNKFHCYTFELCSLYNRIVTVYENTCVYLLTGRDRLNGLEFTSQITRDIARDIQVLVPRLYTIDTMDEAIRVLNEFNPQDEGFVLCKEKNVQQSEIYSLPKQLKFSIFSRIKLKNPAYVALHHLRTGGSMRDFIELICGHGELDEFVSVFPEFKDYGTDIYNKFLVYCKECEVVVSEMKTKTFETRKDAALWIKQQPQGIQPYMFNSLTKPVSTVKEFLSKMAAENPDKIIDILQIKKEDMVFKMP